MTKEVHLSKAPEHHVEYCLEADESDEAAGGGHPTNAYWLPGCCPHVIGREIRLPESFDALVAEGAAELEPKS